MILEIVPITEINPSGSVVQEYLVDENATKLLLACYTKTKSIGPTTPLTVKVMQSFHDDQDIWFEITRFNSSIDPLTVQSKTIEILPMCKKIRITATGNKTSAVEFLAILSVK